MATTSFIYLFFSSLGSLPRPPWVVGYWLLVRGQQAAICWQAGQGSERLGGKGGVVGPPPPSIQQLVASKATVVYILKGLPLHGVQ